MKRLNRLSAWWAPALVLAGVALLATPVEADAQYFGRNKVQYRTFDFRVLKTEHFDIYYYPEEEAATRDAARMAERWYTRLSRLLNHQFDERQPLVLYGSHPAFQQTTTIQSTVGEGTGGVTEGLQQRVIMPLTGSYQETDHVLGHELVHAFQYDISGLGRSRGSLTSSARALGTAPLWFVEGMAEYLSVGPVDAHTAMWLRDAALTGNIPTVAQLERVFPYRWGQALWAYIGGRWGDAVIGQILGLIGQGVPYNQAMERILNIELEELSEDFATSIRRAYLPLLAERPEAREIARPLITQTREGGQVNIGPAVSPDGRLVAFLSELAYGDIELWLANAETGEIIERLRKGSALDPHFQSLRYINSAGSWSPDGERFVFSALRGGQDRLVFIETDGDIVEEVDIPEVIEIATPNWSPDGRLVVFSGIVGGVSDLYAYDVQTRQTRRLTEDLYAQLHPSVSPDGSTVAFITDLGPGTDLGTLEYGGYQLATLELSTGEVRVVDTGPGQSINPVWTRDGRGLYFVSNRGGAPNIYRLDLATEELFQLTNLFGGVSGITDISPAISAARSADRLLFSAYEDTGYNIYSLTRPEELAGTPVDPAQTERSPLIATLPPVPRPEQAPFNRVTMALTDPATGLPSTAQAAAWEVVPYDPDLGLDYLGQPTVGYSTGGVMGQGGLYGGIFGVFSDVLGYHTVYGAVQAQGQLDEIGFAAMYLNQRNRWNYGAQAQRLPYIALGYGGLAFDTTSVEGDQAFGTIRDRVLRQRIFNTSLQGVAQYPFSPAQRFEISSGYRRIARDIQVLEVSGPAVVQNGQLVSYQFTEQDQYEMEGSDFAWNLFETSAALVYDNALFGYTSPFAGQRYRFEATPVVGSLNYVQALADFRRYFWFRPFTIATQGLHFGRYGEDADGTFYPLFLAEPSFVRGYRGVYNACVDRDANCDPNLLNQLFGSRVAVAKAELRFPLLQALIGGAIPIPPVEGFVFGDAGVTWDNDSSPVAERFRTDFAPDERGIVTSAGVGARLNLFGYFIVEVNYVNAFQWEDRGWHWQFALQPGF